jgi:hypothetical protein
MWTGTLLCLPASATATPRPGLLVSRDLTLECWLDRTEVEKRLTAATSNPASALYGARFDCLTEVDEDLAYDIEAEDDTAVSDSGQKKKKKRQCGGEGRAIEPGSSGRPNKKAAAAKEDDWDDGSYWEVEKIVGSHDSGGEAGVFFLVRWLGYAAVHDSWEPADQLVQDLDNFHELVLAFDVSKGDGGGVQSALAQKAAVLAAATPPPPPTAAEAAGPTEILRRGARYDSASLLISPRLVSLRVSMHTRWPGRVTLVEAKAQLAVGSRI